MPSLLCLVLIQLTRAAPGDSPIPAILQPDPGRPGPARPRCRDARPQPRTTPAPGPTSTPSAQRVPQAGALPDPTLVLGIQNDGFNGIQNRRHADQLLAGAAERPSVLARQAGAPGGRGRGPARRDRGRAAAGAAHPAGRGRAGVPRSPPRPRTARASGATRVAVEAGGGDGPGALPGGRGARSRTCCARSWSAPGCGSSGSRSRRPSGRGWRRSTGSASRRSTRRSRLRCPWSTLASAPCPDPTSCSLTPWRGAPTWRSPPGAPAWRRRG